MQNRYVGEPGAGVVRHRVPGVGAGRPRRYEFGAVLVTGAGPLDRPPGFHVHVRCPVRLGEGFGRDQPAVRAVDHVEKPVLGRMHQGLNRAAVDLEVGQHDIHVGVVIPGLPGRGLVMPQVVARVRVERHHRAQEQVVAAARAADLPVPGRAVAGADVKLVELGVVGEAVPGVAAAAELPPFAGPGFGRHAHRLAFEAVGRVAGHDVKTPGLLARFRVVGRDVAPVGSGLGPAIANQHLALENLGGAGDVKRHFGVECSHAPDRFTRRAIDRDQAAVPGGQVNLVLPDADAAVVFPAGSKVIAGVPDHVGVELPHQLTRRGVQRPDPVHAADEIHHAVDHEGRGYQAAVIGQVDIPVHAELRDIGRVDLVERAVALLAVGAPKRQPVLPVGLVRHGRVVDHGGETLLRRGGFTGRTGSGLRRPGTGDTKHCDEQRQLRNTPGSSHGLLPQFRTRPRGQPGPAQGLHQADISRQ